MPKAPDTITLYKNRPDPATGTNFAVFDTETQHFITHSCLGLDPYTGDPRWPRDLTDARMVRAAAMATGAPRRRFVILWDDAPVAEQAVQQAA